MESIIKIPKGLKERWILDYNTISSGMTDYIEIISYNDEDLISDSVNPYEGYNRGKWYLDTKNSDQNAFITVRVDLRYGQSCQNASFRFLEANNSKYLIRSYPATDKTLNGRNPKLPSNLHFTYSTKEQIINEMNEFLKRRGYACTIKSDDTQPPTQPPTTQPPTPGKSQQQEYFFIDKAETMKYLQGQDITISCEVDGDIELESGGVLFQYQLEGQDTYTDVKAEVTTSSTGKKRIWVRVKLP